MRVKFAVLSFVMMVLLSSCGRSNECYQGSTDPSCPATYGGTSQNGQQGGSGNGYDSYGGDYAGGGQSQGYNQGPNQGYGQQQGNNQYGGY